MCARTGRTVTHEKYHRIDPLPTDLNILRENTNGTDDVSIFYMRYTTDGTDKKNRARICIP